MSYTCFYNGHGIFWEKKILAPCIQLRAEIRHFVALLPCQGSASLNSIEFRAHLNVTACVIFGPIWQYLFHTNTKHVMSTSADKKTSSIGTEA